ncbi:hypothetical protein PQR02_26520 [Paraburkholderia sediminicola]|uniref:Uncharacterized protein n=1 Tax=Paraburkholderia rhynchosiae TaxID=487049 RepID=A0ACC7NGT6_9BURK
MVLGRDKNSGYTIYLNSLLHTMTKEKSLFPLAPKHSREPGAQAARRLLQACRQLDRYTGLIAEFLLNLHDGIQFRVDTDKLCWYLDDRHFRDVLCVMRWRRFMTPCRFCEIFGDDGEAVMKDLTDRFETEPFRFVMRKT